ncbi:flagellar hook protein FlgE [Sphingosinicella sp. CPCC 101087]|uniref:flagellar hook protein FlgE n=1 Tax=Sphingosinicella sp. CPCC 101087 TaxID=2497754 RepID=UPI00101BDA48|nr:flagellar hook protein FlgE [Sphingosinicella sp. CPCC 101087]
MSFYTSLSGLRGAQTDLATISNNVANVGSYGFKRSRASFGDIMPASSTTAGQGTRLKGIEQQFTQGGFESSARELDIAISGSGFFVTRDGLTGGTTYFTRNGSLQINPNGYLVDSNGSYMMVLPVDSDGNATARTLGAAQTLQLPESSGTPAATSGIDLSVSLPSSAAVKTGTFDRLDPNTYNYSEQTTVYDSAGNAIPATLYFVRTASVAGGDAADEWEVNMFVGNEQASADPASATPTALTLTFDASGALTAPAGAHTFGDVFPAGASAPLSIALNFGSATQQASAAFAVNSLEQNGVASARLNDISIGDDGLVTATFSDGSTQALGKLMMANFSNPEGLRQAGDGRWTVSGNSGEAQIGTPGGDGFGEIQTGTLERANVEITEELVALISAQRNFQANAKAIETANAMTQSIMNMRS